MIRNLISTWIALAASTAPFEAPAQMPGTTFRDCATCPEMVVVPPGAFSMGTDTINPMRGGEMRPEGPVRQVTIAKPFAAGVTEVTNRSFAEFVTATGRDAVRECSVGMNTTVVANISFEGPLFGRTPAPDEPAVCVSWVDAKDYAAWLSVKTGKSYRLLTEAEWEYAAKAGSTATWPWGDDETQACKYENTYDLDAAAEVPNGATLPWAAVQCHDGHVRIAPVASYAANAFGLYDMLGNVWEWTQDCSLTLYPDAPADGSAVEVGGVCEKRAVRGGSWYTQQPRHRPTFRGRDPIDKAAHHFGFRIARDVE